MMFLYLWLNRTWWWRSLQCPAATVLNRTRLPQVKSLLLFFAHLLATIGNMFFFFWAVYPCSLTAGWPKQECSQYKPTPHIVMYVEWTCERNIRSKFVFQTLLLSDFHSLETADITIKWASVGFLRILIRGHPFPRLYTYHMNNYNSGGTQAKYMGSQFIILQGSTGYFYVFHQNFYTGTFFRTRCSTALNIYMCGRDLLV